MIGFIRICFSFTVKEEAPPGTFVGQLAGLDRHGNYCFTSSCGWSSLFALNKQDGAITTTSPIDRETISSITLTLTGTDSHGGNVLEVITVEIEDINDNSPQFSDSQYRLEVSENMGPQSFDLLSWSDEDYGENGRLKKVQILELEDQSWPFIPEIRTSGSFQQVVLKITRSLDREIRDQYHFTVEIEDNGYPAQTGTLDITVIVQDINDNSPEFDQSSYQFQILENSSIPYPIHIFSAPDVDEGDNGQVQYSISFDYDTPYFSMNEQTGQLLLIRKLDYEDCPRLRKDVKGFTFTVTARDMGVSPRSNSVSVEIEVIDVNDNSPVIRFDSPYMVGPDTVEIEENIDINSYTATISVTDRDSGQSGEVDVTIDGGDFGKFKLTSSNGLLLLTADQLDREEIPSYGVVIKATDRGRPSLSSSKTLTVNVIDINDNYPIFTKSIYTQTVPENALVGTFILDVIANDPDNGFNGSVSYRIESQTGDFFQISSGGSISSVKELDAESSAFHILNVSASDGGYPSLKSYTIVNITVLDVNDNTPVFEKSLYSCNTIETAVVGSVICSVSASDLDHGNNGKVFYSIDQTSHDSFTINASSGEIKLSAVLDFENAKEYQLTIKASDGGNPSRESTCEVVITVQDINDELPIFDPVSYSATIPEGVLFSSIVQVYASDDDVGDTIHFSLTSADAQFFAISPSGVISNTQKLQFMGSGTSYNFRVTASDTASNEANPTASVTIKVVEKSPDLPVFSVGVIKASVSEDSPVGHLVTTVIASTESTCSITYSLTPPSDHFTMGSSTGMLTLKNKIDFEILERFSLSVTATCRSAEGHAILEVDVLDANDNSPQCNNMGDIFVRENANTGSVIFTCSCSDADSELNGQLTYAMISNNAPFYVSPDSGELALSSSLDRETLPEIPLVLRVCDKGLPTNRCSDFNLTVHVTDENDNPPEFLPPFTFYVKEDVKINHAIGKLNAQDIDEGRNSQFTFTILNSVPQIKAFSSGELVVNELLDFEMIDRFFLNVRVSDQGNPQLSTDTIITIIVQDSNDNSPVFDQAEYSFNVKEHQSVPHYMGSVLATDRDTGDNGRIVYSILESSSVVTINSTSGDLFLVSSVDYESSSTVLMFNVEATDLGDPSLKSQASILVNIVDINDHTPEFTQTKYTAEVPENASINTKVLEVSATDKDGPLNNEISYSFEQNENNFRIDSSTGAIYVTSHLDFEETKTYNITVKAADNGTPEKFSLSTVLISVTDVNDNAPEFETNLLQIGVVESTSPGTVVKTIHASDKDTENNGQVTYEIITESHTGTFFLDGSSGELKLMKTLQFAGEVYTLTVRATDHGATPLSSEQNIEITVIDVNDNSPVFIDGISSAEVVEGTPSGTLVFQVEATDDDTGPAGIVSYNISSDVFTIEKMTGKIYTGAVLDRETVSSLHLTICATDQASPASEQLSVCKVVEITVLDINDNAPVFINASSKIYVSENTPVGSEIITINALDADYLTNGTISYSILLQNPAGIVSIDRVTGVLSLSQPLDYELSSIACQFTIEIKDTGIPQLSNRKDFYLNVLDYNDNAPVFINPLTQRLVYLSSQVTPGSIIYHAIATDADIGDNGKVRFSLSNHIGGIFSIGAITGEVEVIKPIDSEFEKSLVTIRATDLGSPSLFSEMVINVMYKEANSKPICPGKSYLEIPEDTISFVTIFTVKCYDLDWGARGMLQYSILNGNIGNTFSISAEGQLSLTQNKLDFEQIELYTLIILVEDEGRPSLKQVFILEITVTNVNDEAPVFPEGETVINLSESTASGTLLQTVSASDPDGDSVSYSISASEECENYFLMNSQTGQLTLKKQIGPSLTDSTDICQVFVSATDGTFTSSTLLSIRIIDDDSHAPIFYSSSAFTVNPASSDILGAVGASDSDPGDSVLIYTLQSSKRSTGIALDPNSGVLYCPDASCSAGNVDIEVSGRALSQSKLVTITFNSSPTLQIFSETLYEFSVKESAAVDFLFGHITVDHAPDQIRIEGGNDGLSFKIDNLNLAVNNKLDYELWSTYNLTVCAVSEAVSTFATIIVKVEDINDNVPVFLPASLRKEVDSNIAVGTTIHEAKAFDGDSGLAGELVYYLQDSVFNEYFTIETETGVIAVKKDLSMAPIHMDLQIKAKDQGSPALTSNTFNLIIDIVHQPATPQFRKTSYTFSVYADASSYSFVGSIHVTNNLNNDFTFSFQRDSPYFSIYSVSGTILQKSSIQDSQLTEVKEMVKVVSRTDPAVFGKVPVTIAIIQSICTPNPCKNGGDCIGSVDSFICECPPGTAGETCECNDKECPNGGLCHYNSTMNTAMCLCDDGVYKENCDETDQIIMIAIIAGIAFVLLVIIICVCAYCIIRSKRRKDKKAANTEFDHAVNGTKLGSHKRPKGQLHLQDNICMNPINISNLDNGKVGYPEFSYTNHDYDLDSPGLPIHTPSGQYTPRSFAYAASDSGRSSQCTEAVIFRKLKQVDEPNSLESQRRDKDSGLAGSLNTLCHFDMDYNNEDYLHDWGPKVQNLVNVLDLEDVVLDEDTPIKEEFV